MTAKSALDNRMDLREFAFATHVTLCAKRSAELLGNITDLARETFKQSLIGGVFPSFWLEVPLVGEPGFDLHVYYDRDQVQPDDRFAEGAGFGMQALFDWYFGLETGGVGVGFAHDLHAGQRVTGAYVNFNSRPLDDARGFFGALGSPKLRQPAIALMAGLPKSWHPWYLGLFPGRPDAGVRVGSFVPRVRQADYARDALEIAADLQATGFYALDDEMLRRVQALAALPYQLEMQLDATEAGTGETLGVDLTLELDSPRRAHEAFAADGAAAQACALLETWGVADDRWRAIASSSFGTAIPLPAEAGADKALLMSCLPAFIKVKWRNGQPQPAKVYLQCAARPVALAG